MMARKQLESEHETARKRLESRASQVTQRLPADAVRSPKKQKSPADKAKARQAKLSVAGSMPLAFSRKASVRPVQPEASDLVDSSLRHSLRVPEANATATYMPVPDSFPDVPSGTNQTSSPASRENSGPNEARIAVLPRPWRPYLGPIRPWRKVSAKVATESSATLPSNSTSDVKINSRDQPATENTVELSEATQDYKATDTQNLFGKLFPAGSALWSGSGSRPSEAAFTKKAVIHKSKHRHVLKPRGGIFEKLFPDGVSREPEEKVEDTSLPPPPSREESPDDVIFVSLRNEVRNWIPEDQRNVITAPDPGNPGSYSTVVILSGLSSTLVASDFYRIIPEARDIEGWAGGLVKVVQARDRLSHEPIGRYFLMFHSRPAAEAYKGEILRLHALSKRLLHSSTGTGALDDAPVDPQTPLTKEEEDAVRRFTLCPPTAPLLVHMAMWRTKLVAEIAEDANLVDVVRALRPDAHTPSKVLVTVNTIPGTKGSPGGGLTVDELWLTLRDDGRERGAPWVLSNLKEGIMPVKLISTSRHNKIIIRSESMYAPLNGPIYDELDMLAEPPPIFTGAGAAADAPAMRKVVVAQDFTRPAEIAGRLGQWAPAPEHEEESSRVIVDRDARFHRFIVTFAQPAVSKRFVRSWHKRAIWDAHEGRSVSIDAVALMQ